MSNQTNKVLDRLMLDLDRPSPEALYHQIGRLRTEMPDWKVLAKPESSKWIGRAIALIEAADCTIDLLTLRAEVGGLMSHKYNHDRVADAIALVLDTVLAKLELKLPVEARGVFIPAGGAFDAFQAVAKAVGSARSDVLLVDPYADETLVMDFAPLIPEKVQILVLSDQATCKPSLRPAADRWIEQYKGKRPLAVRLAAAKTLHDRLIVSDGTIAWVVGQSFKDLAKRAHTSLVRMDPESAALKVAAYKDLWLAATKLA